MAIDLINMEEELASYKGQWFVINCNSGHEDSVKADLLQKIESSNLEEKVFDIRISKSPVMGKNNKIIDKNKFPGYIFINMHMTDETWFIIRNTPGVTGFIGSSGRGAKPLPLTSEEVFRLLNQDEVSNKDKKFSKGNANQPKKEKVLFEATFKLKDVVLVKDGPFANTEGQVIEMDFEKGIAIVNIELFGRITPTEFEFASLSLAYKY
ncbi:transcription termination/antitermination protein NusG [Spiroplasma turonicum]|uniref:Transcription termination/antitermination protein NusG n=1 Tax=Spiroplasma turonicum TaxID=216946 RepID=A0A0K1P4Q1_9MOLU|nr:transcription termination/antitermination protein NusG [Spiroplasma turonicum]AKU79280.1 transcription antitermination protein NusG [Spiroplasma turonicum]ALX70303.1 transcription antitermination protein NusG [Spiroplasma turonicum]